MAHKAKDRTEVILDSLIDGLRDLQIRALDLSDQEIHRLRKHDVWVFSGLMDLKDGLVRYRRERKHGKNPDDQKARARTEAKTG